MKTAIALLFLTLPFSCLAQTQKELVKDFNSVAERNNQGGKEKALVTLKCGSVSETMSFIASSGEVSLILEVDSDASGHNVYKSSMYGQKTSDDFETVLGWEYYFSAPQGQIVVTLENSGLIHTDVSVLHGEGYRKSKSKCRIENLIKS